MDAQAKALRHEFDQHLQELREIISKLRKELDDEDAT